MTEQDAERLVCEHVPRETSDLLQSYVLRLREEAQRQNLISAATLDRIWQRHILDSAQLLALGGSSGPWLDIGTGAGLPGLVIAILRDAPIVLLEPRAKRAAFLQSLVDNMRLSARATVVAKTAASAPAMRAAVISARAVAPLDALFAMGLRFATDDTVWVLPKGRRAADELAAAKASWQGDFRLVPSQTDSSAAIVVARGVRPKR